MDKDESDKKPSFMKRLIAFFIDIILVSFVASCIAMSFVDTNSIQKLNDQLVEMSDKYVKQEIDTNTYFNESSSISYQLARKNGTTAFITIFVEILYFIVFQLYNKGQTLGKMLMKIKVISVDGELTSNQLMFRALIINSILYSIISFAFMIFASSTTYFYGILLFELIQYIVLLISAGMIIFSKNKRGLHDLVANTKVVKVC